MEIKKVLLRKDGIKYLIIPKNSDLKKDDLFMINKIDQKEEIKNAKRN